MSSESIRLGPTSYVVLGLIDVFGPSSPYDLKGRIEMTVENFWPVPHTTFYVEPDRLAEAGLLSVEQEQHGRRKKVYSITPAGKEALAAWVAEPTAAPPQLRDELVLKVFLGADPAPLVDARLAWHREKLAELEGYLETVRAEGGMPGIERSLIAGTEYTKAVLTMFDKLRRA